MTKTLAMVRALAATAGRDDNERIVADAFRAGEREFFALARLACDKLVSFGVAKVAAIADEDLDPDAPGTLSFADFMALAGRLRRRELAGRAARDAINDAAGRCHGPTWNEVYRRVLLKDLRIGCDGSTVNRALKALAKDLPEAAEWLVPAFKCQSAEDGDAPAHRGKVRGRKLLDLRLDGVRALALLDKDAGASLLTRDGRPIETLPEVRAGLDQVLALLPGSVVLDGQLVSPKGFRHLAALLRTPGQDTSAVRFALFDMMPLDDFRAGLCSAPQWRRHASLSLLETSGALRQCGGRAYVLEKQEVDLDAEAGRASFQDFVRAASERGLKGVMLKDPEAPYECKRTAAWLFRSAPIAGSGDLDLRAPMETSRRFGLDSGPN